MPGPSTSPISSMVDWADSHYNYVMQRVLAINPNRKFGGIVQARSWPIEQAVPESFYLLLGMNTPLNSRGVASNPWSAKLYGEKIQWAWQIIGTDNPSNVIMRNRGDRYRTNFAMTQELLQGMAFGFCEKLQFGLEEINGSPVVTATSYYPQESIWWKAPIFADRFDKSSGILFGYGSSEISGFSPTIQSGSFTPPTPGTPVPIQPSGIPHFADAESPRGAIDGFNTTFTLANSPSPALSLNLFVNGVRMSAGQDFDLADNVITMYNAPPDIAVLLAYYRY